MSNLSLEVISVGKEGTAGLFIDGKLHLYWLDLYKKLGITPQHARKIILKLTEGVHYVPFTREEIQVYKNTVNTVFMVPPNASMAYFLSAEGWNRAIIEIRTSEMDDKRAVEKIEKIRDEMASIYTRYQKGEVLSLATDRGQVPQIPEKVSVSDALTEQMKRANAMTIVGVDLGKAASVCLAKVEEQFPDEDLGYLRSMLVRQIDGEIGYLTATAIGKEIGATNRTINNILCQAGYQYRTERTKKNGKTEWVYNLTEKGKLFGEVHVGRFGGSERYVILWRSTVIDEIRRVIFSSESQSTLSGVA